MKSFPFLYTRARDPSSQARLPGGFLNDHTLQAGIKIRNLQDLQVQKTERFGSDGNVSVSSAVAFAVCVVAFLFFFNKTC